MSNLTLRYYQKECIDALESAWFESPRCLVCAPTGSGKTVTSSVVIENGLPGRSLFIADQDELCKQPLRVFQRASGIFAALEKSGNKASLDANVVVASSQSLARKARRERFRKDHFSRIIVDEAHRRTCADIEICDYFETAFVAGMTATPLRQGVSDLSKWYPEVAYRMTAIDFVEQGFMPPEEILTLPIEINLKEAKTAMTPDGREYKAEDAADAIEPYFDQIAELFKKHAPDRFGIAYLPLIESSKKFAECLRRHGISARHVDGQMDDRDLILDTFSRNRKGAPTFQWLCNAGVVSTGVDIPVADAFACLRPTNSAAWYQQARGRTWRVLPGVIDDLPGKDQAAERKARIAASGKPNTLIFDFLWQDGKLGVQRPGDMYAENEEDARAIFEASKKRTGDPIKALEIAKAVQKERESQLVSALNRAAIKCNGSMIQAQQIGGLLKIPEIAAYMPMHRWEHDKPSESQLSALAAMGIETASLETKGIATRIMNELSWRRQCGLATLKQVRTISEHNERLPYPLRIKNVESLEFAEASRHIDQIIKMR